MITGGFFENAGEKLKEMGQATAQTAKKQVAGGRQFAQMAGKMKKMNPQQLAAAKKQDLQGAVGEADQVRAQLKQEQIKRYQQIQREIEEYRGKKGEEIPKYISGKPGEASTPEEQQEKMEKQKEEQRKFEKEQKKGSELSPFAERMKGSREKGRIIAG